MTSNPFDKSVSTPTLSFSTKDEYGRVQPKPIGTRLGGTVKKSPEIVQSRVYEGSDKGKPMYWDADGKGKTTTAAQTPDGRKNNPVQQIVIVVTCADGEDRSFWVSFYPKAQFESIQNAITGPDGQLRAIEPGDTLYTTLSGLTPVAGKNPSYAYTSEFTKGAGVFSAPPAPPVAAAPPPPAAPTVEAVLSNGFTASALSGSGWTAEQIAALSTPVAPAGPPAPPAAPAADPQRADKLATLSDEDRKLLNLV